MGIKSVGLLLWMLLAPSLASKSFKIRLHSEGHCPFIKSEFICGSDGKTYKSVCKFLRAQLSDPTLYIAYRDRCRKDKNFPRTTTLPRWMDPDYPFDKRPTTIAYRPSRPRNKYKISGEIGDFEPMLHSTPSKHKSDENEDSYKPEDSDKSEDNYKPDDDNKPENSYKPDDDYKPEDSYKPDDYYKPEDSYKPDDDYKPEDSYKPDDGYKPDDDYKPEDSYKPDDDYKPEDIYKPEDSYRPDDDYKPEDNYKPNDDYKPDETDQEQFEDKPVEEISNIWDTTRRPEEGDTENSAEYNYPTSRNPRTRKRQTTPRTMRTTKRRTTPRITRATRSTRRRTTRRHKPTTRRRSTTKTVRRNKRTQYPGCILCGKFNVSLNVIWNKKEFCR